MSTVEDLNHVDEAIEKPKDGRGRKNRTPAQIAATQRMIAAKNSG